jgi:hypothetical protein
MASLGVSHIFAVYIHKGAGGNTLQNIVHPAPEGLQPEFPLINTAGIGIRDIGRVTGVRIVDVGIIGILIAKQLPAGWNGHGVPTGDFFRNIDIAGIKGKPPLPIQEHIFRISFRNIVSALGQSVFTGFQEIFVNSHRYVLLLSFVI